MADDIIQTIKETVRIEEIIEGDGFHLVGRGRYRKCAQHDSLVVDLANQAYHWNSMGEHGDVITWTENRFTQGDCKSAVEMLCRKAGLEDPNWGKQSVQQRVAARLREDALHVAAGLMHKWLLESEEAMAYAHGRGWDDATIKQAQLGYTGTVEQRAQLQEVMLQEMGGRGVDPLCPPAVAVLGLGFAQKRKISVESWGREYGVKPREEWLKQGYIPGVIGWDMMVYPHTWGGRVRYLSLRGIHEKRHYNLPAELAGDRQVYCNSAYARAERAVALVEGQADAVTLGQWGIPAVALAGVSGDETLIRMLGVDEDVTRPRENRRVVYIGLDADAAGHANEWKLARLIGPMARIVEWPGTGDASDLEKGGERVPVKDANDLLLALNQRGVRGEDQPPTIRGRLNTAPTYAEAMAAWAGGQKGAERDAALRQALEVIVQMDELSRAQYQVSLARLLDISQREFGRMVKTTEELVKKKKETGDATETLGGVIAGWLVEYLYDPREHRAALAWRDANGKTGSGESVEIDGRHYIAVVPTDTMKNGGVLFPSALGKSKTTGELVAILESWISSVYLLGSRLDAKIMAYYTLLTWVYDCFNTIPYLRAMGEAGAGKSELMRRIGMCCYRLMSANGAGTAASLFRSVERYRGTVFIDEADLQQSDTTNDIIKFLNLGAMRNNPIWRLEEVTGPDGRKEYVEKMYTTFCPKLIAMRKDFRDDAVGSRCLTFKIQPRETLELVAAKIPLEVNQEMRARAEAIRNLCLRWRLEHWEPEIPVDPSFYDLDISSRLNQVTGPLIAMAADDPQLQGEMRQFLREYYAELTLTKSMTITARVIEALWKIYRYPDLYKELVVKDPDGGERVLVGQVTRIANEIINDMNAVGDDREEDTGSGARKKRDELSPQRIGRLIREELQLRVSPRTNKGFWVYWDQIRMEAVAKRYGINPDEVAMKVPASPAQPGLGV